MNVLRSNFDPGTTRWAVRRSQWRAMGIDPADFDKPKIAVVNSSSQLSVCYTHLDDLAREVAEEIRANGGLPFEIRTVAPSDFVTSAGRSARYLLPSRDLIVNDIEAAVEGALLDGMVCLSSCDKTAPAHLMAAGRLNLPTTVLIGGYQTGGLCNGVVTDIDDVYESVGAVSAGRMSTDELRELTDCAIKGPGVCAGMGTANSMHILSEALGMTVAGTSPVRAGSPRMSEHARRGVRNLMGLLRNDVRPRVVMTEAAFRNAVMAALAIGASVNAPRHLQAIAIECGLDLDVYELIEKYADLVPMLCTVRPNGPHRIEDLEAAGGTLGVMKRLERLLDTSAMTVSGERWSDVLAGATVDDQRIIGTVQSSLDRGPGLALFRGSLAPEGAVVKTGAFPKGRTTFEGPARVFDDEDDAISAIRDHTLGGGEVAVLRGMGPLGGPGTVFAASFVAALNGAGLASEIACVTDGELSGLNRGITIGQVMPEAAQGGPLALVHDGDVIRISAPDRSVDLLVDAAELERRAANWTPPEFPDERSWLSFYRQLVEPMSRGAVLRSSPTAPMTPHGKG